MWDACLHLLCVRVLVYVLMSTFVCLTVVLITTLMEFKELIITSKSKQPIYLKTTKLNMKPGSYPLGTKRKKTDCKQVEAPFFPRCKKFPLRALMNMTLVF